jgi:hypothetical protein
MRFGDCVVRAVRDAEGFDGVRPLSVTINESGGIELRGAAVETLFEVAVHHCFAAVGLRDFDGGVAQFADFCGERVDDTVRRVHA